MFLLENDDIVCLALGIELVMGGSLVCCEDGYLVCREDGYEGESQGLEEKSNTMRLRLFTKDRRNKHLAPRVCERTGLPPLLSRVQHHVSSLSLLLLLLFCFLSRVATARLPGCQVEERFRKRKCLPVVTSHWQSIYYLLHPTIARQSKH
jgi:hypothetical protein